jgi:hypothetical protein
MSVERLTKEVSRGNVIIAYYAASRRMENGKWKMENGRGRTGESIVASLRGEWIIDNG